MLPFINLFGRSINMYNFLSIWSMSPFRSS